VEHLAQTAGIVEEDEVGAVVGNHHPAPGKLGSATRRLLRTGASFGERAQDRFVIVLGGERIQHDSQERESQPVVLDLDQGKVLVNLQDQVRSDEGRAPVGELGERIRSEHELSAKSQSIGAH
jgi:hypothetical protein